jgi:hypothetical protein
MVIFNPYFLALAASNDALSDNRKLRGRPPIKPADAILLLRKAIECLA